MKKEYANSARPYHKVYHYNTDKRVTLIDRQRVSLFSVIIGTASNSTIFPTSVLQVFNVDLRKWLKCCFVGNSTAFTFSFDKRRHFQLFRILIYNSILKNPYPHPAPPPLPPPPYSTKTPHWWGIYCVIQVDPPTKTDIQKCVLTSHDFF